MSASKEITIETVWTFQEDVFTPPVRVAPSRSAGSVQRDTPVQAATAVFAAMHAGDFDAWLACWTEEDRRALLARASPEAAQDPALRPRSREDWIAAWRAGLAGRDVLLTAQATTPDFAIIGYEIVLTGDTPADDGAESRDAPRAQRRILKMLFVTKGEEWFQTNAFSAHPVLLMWRSGQQTLRNSGLYEAQKRRLAEGAP